MVRKTKLSQPEELIDRKAGIYHIRLYKHKISNITGIREPYELIISINMTMPGDFPDYRETYHVYHAKKKEAMDIINKLPTNTCRR